jgi:CRP-like cAMP-binding protein
MEISAKLQLLKQTPYFASLPLSEIRELVPRLLERHYRAGDLIFRKGDQSEGLCVVLSGRVRTETTSEEGREQVLKVFGPGRTFADIPAFDGEPQPANAIAVSNSTVALLRRTDLLDLIRRHPDVGIDVIRLFASRLRAYKVMVEDLSLRDVVSRVARLLHDRARGQTTIVEDSSSVSLRYTQNEVAAMVGSVREVVQRAPGSDRAPIVVTLLVALNLGSDDLAVGREQYRHQSAIPGASVRTRLLPRAHR